MCKLCETIDHGCLIYYQIPSSWNIPFQRKSVKWINEESVQGSKLVVCTYLRPTSVCTLSLDEHTTSWTTLQDCATIVSTTVTKGPVFHKLLQHHNFLLQKILLPILNTWSTVVLNWIPQYIGILLDTLGWRGIYQLKALWEKNCNCQICVIKISYIAY